MAFNLLKHLTSIGITIDNVNCTHCGKPHSDLDEWCYKPHKTHLCEHCGNEFEGNVKGVSNPVLSDEDTTTQKDQIIQFCRSNK